jgi:cytochrome c-type biogenesis protein CcmE
MTRKRRRLFVVLLCGVGLGSATALALVAFRGSLVFFEAPSQLIADAPRQGQVIRLGGLVEEGSLRHVVVRGKPTARFRVTDGKASVPVTYVGILPDLFREGQGLVAAGEMRADGVFGATEVLAKHDETYMPRDVAAALEKSGRWNPAAGPPPPASTWDMLMPKQGARG